MIQLSGNLDRIARQLSQSISDELDRVGIFHRIFFRTKKNDSINAKIISKGYDGISSLLQDLIGIRINLYFVDDIEIVYPFLKQYFIFVDETIDINEETVFKPTRINLIFKIPKEHNQEFKDVAIDKHLDNTFELQLRTVLSEGWHEVDHDLRYKCKSDWDENKDLGRMFNGVLASLEASEWTILQIFQNLSFRHYKLNSLSSMIKSKFRIRIKNDVLNEHVLEAIKSENELMRSIFKIDRNDFLNIFLASNIIMPLNLTNLVFLFNYLYLKNEKLHNLTPEILLEEFRS